MGKAILGWAGALGLVAFAVHAFTQPPSAAQQAATQYAQIQADNARLACAQGVTRAC